MRQLIFNGEMRNTDHSFSRFFILYLRENGLIGKTPSKNRYHIKNMLLNYYIQKGIF